jgi:alkyl hydroperoxide reductase subunit AhpC
LADFQALFKDFESEEIKIIAASVDPIEKAKEFVEKIGVAFPVGYGLNAEEISRVTGAFYEKEKKFLHATGFIIRPDKTIVNACYSSGPIGRFSARDSLNLIKSYKSEKEKTLGFLIRHLGSIPR